MSKKIVFTFGRFNPPTVGHLLLANAVKKIARKEKAEHRIYASSINDPKRNPLSYRVKIAFMKKILKGSNVVSDENIKDAFKALQKLSDEGYTDVIMVVGSDRVTEFQRAKRYVGPKKLFKFKSLKIVSAGERDPDAEGVSGMSASKMRSAASDGRLDSFRLGLPPTFPTRDVKRLFTAVQKGMKVKPKIVSEWFDFNEFIDFCDNDGVSVIIEGDAMYKAKVKRFDDRQDLQQKHAKERQKQKEVEARDAYKAKVKDVEDGQPISASVEYGEEEIEINEISVQARRKMAKSARRTSKKRARTRARKAKRKKSGVELRTKSNREARNMIRKKILKSMKWTDVSIQQKERIETMLNKKKAKISKLAKRLYPAMQKKEVERLKSVRAKMTTTNPKKAMEDINVLFTNVLEEGSRAGVERLANREMKHSEKSAGGPGVSDRNSKNHIEHHHEESWEQSENPWDHVILVLDLEDNAYKLLVAHALNPDRHELIMGPSTNPDVKSKRMVTRGWAENKANKAIRDEAKDPNKPGWMDTPTSKDLMKHDKITNARNVVAKEDGVPEEGQAPVEGEEQAPVEGVEQAPVGDFGENSIFGQSGRTFEEHASAKKKETHDVNGISKSGGSVYPDWDHKPEDLEAGITVWQNITSGMTEEDAIAGLGEKQAGRLVTSATAMQCAKKLYESNIAQIVEATDTEPEDWVGVHSGTGITDPKNPKKKLKAKELLDNKWMNPELGGEELTGQGGTDATPKADLIIKNKNTGEMFPISLKTGNAQAMSGKAGESRATFCHALNEVEDKLDSETFKEASEVIKLIDEFVTKATTPFGKTSQYKPGMFIPGDSKKSFISREIAVASAEASPEKTMKQYKPHEHPEDETSITKSEKERQLGETWDAIQAMLKVHEKFNKKLNNLLEKCHPLQHAIMKEALTGAGKFGKKGEELGLSAKYVLSSHKDGTGAKLYKINDDYITSVMNDEGTRYGVRNKSNQRQKTGAYSFYSGLSINIKQLLRIPFEQDLKKALNAGYISFAEYTILMEALENDEIKEIDFDWVYNYFKTTPTPDISAKEYMERAKKWIGDDLGKLMQFLHLDIESIEAGNESWADIAQNSGDYNTIEINGKIQKISVMKGDDEDDTEEDTLDDYIQQNRAEEEEPVVKEALTFSTFRKSIKEDYAKLADRRAYLKKTVKKRSKRTMARRQAIKNGKVKVGDGNDIDHVNGNAMDNSSGNLQVMPASKNRGKGNNKWRKNHEEHGAGEVGTDELLKKYLKDTPMMTISKFIKKLDRK